MTKRVATVGLGLNHVHFFNLRVTNTNKPIRKINFIDLLILSFAPSCSRIFSSIPFLLTTYDKNNVETLKWALAAYEMMMILLLLLLLQL